MAGAPVPPSAGHRALPGDALPSRCPHAPPSHPGHWRLGTRVSDPNDLGRHRWGHEAGALGSPSPAAPSPGPHTRSVQLACTPLCSGRPSTGEPKASWEVSRAQGSRERAQVSGDVQSDPRGPVQVGKHVCTQQPGPGQKRRPGKGPPAPPWLRLRSSSNKISNINPR